ncbi:unnamed protein product [Prorocentrum cordatum]|uniref:PAS domain-containing protein n=1 Tax=Prorocentrum cordatum TaxID=2364126 RepID=A0ABN9TWZ2_9DINO|nr:unnamed protein product [Polarella glacialis]
MHVGRSRRLRHWVGPGDGGELLVLAGGQQPANHNDLSRFFVTAWSINLWVFSNHEQARSAAGWHQLPFFLFYAWAAGLHSCFVAQFCFIGCLAIFADPRFDINSQCTLMLLGVSVVATAVVLEWQSVSHFQKLQALLNVSTDGRIVVNRFTGTIVSMSQEASEVLGGRLIGKPFGCLAHDTDRPRVEDWFSRSHGEPSEAFMATLRCGQLPEAKPMQEFEARIIPFEIAGPHLHFCLQVVGEVRAYDVGASSAKESRESAGALTSTYALVTGTPHFAWTRTTSRSTPNYSMSSAASRRDDDECSFAISSSIGQVRPRSLECFGLLSEQDSDDNACALTVSSQSDAIPTTLGRRLPAAPYLAEAGVQTSPLAEDLGLPSLAEAIADALQRHGGRAGAPQRSACCPWHGATEEAALAVEMLRRTACDKYWAASGGIGPPVADADVPPRAREGASEDSREGFGAPPAARLRAPCQASRWGEAPADAAAAGTALESPSVSSPAVRHLLSL